MHTLVLMELLNLSTTNVEPPRKGKSMPQRLVVLVTYVKLALAPLVGVGSYLTLLEAINFEGNKALWGVLGTVVIAFFTYLGVKANARTRVTVKEIETTTSADVDKAQLLLQLFDKAAAELEKSRQHFTQELKEQRLDFFEKEKEQGQDYINKEIETRNHYERRKDDMMKHYEEKEQELRQYYHTKMAEMGQVSERYITRLTKVEAQLKALNVQVTDDGEVMLPISFSERKTTNGNDK